MFVSKFGIIWHFWCCYAINNSFIHSYYCVKVTHQSVFIHVNNDIPIPLPVLAFTLADQELIYNWVEWGTPVLSTLPKVQIHWWPKWDSKPLPLGHKSNGKPLSHDDPCAPECYVCMFVNTNYGLLLDRQFIFDIYLYFCVFLEWSHIVDEEHVWLCCFI